VVVVVVARERSTVGTPEAQQIRDMEEPSVVVPEVVVNCSVRDIMSEQIPDNRRALPEREAVAAAEMPWVMVVVVAVEVPQVIPELRAIRDRLLHHRLFREYLL
tara:strand:+ start:193 stop:504 length:312 start_codon:yes stop_codon:yes gene_type:complete